LEAISFGQRVQAGGLGSKAERDGFEPKAGRLSRQPEERFGRFRRFGRHSENSRKCFSEDQLQQRQTLTKIRRQKLGNRRSILLSYERKCFGGKCLGAYDSIAHDNRNANRLSRQKLAS
jgi:hypothetical protein